MSKEEGRFTAMMKDIVDSDAAKRQREGKTDAPVGSADNPSTKVFTVANVITFCRLALTIAFLVLFVTGENRIAALICYLVAAVTDFLDGQVARRTQTVSWLGKIMDPVMDRVLLFTGVLGLLWVGELPLWIPVFVIGRDIYLAIGALIVRHYRARPVDVVFIGKVATALLMAGFCLMLIGWPEVPALNLVDVSWLPGFNDQSTSLGIYFVYAGVVCSFITACVYTWDAFAIRRESLAEKAEAEAAAAEAKAKPEAAKDASAPQAEEGESK